MPCSGIGKPYVLDQGSDAGSSRVPVSSDIYSKCLQAYSPALPVGTQHYYKNSREALAMIFRAEGFRGLFRGMDAAILRTSMGSSVQLPSYNWIKTQIVSRGILPADSMLTFLASSTISGICVVCPSLPPLLVLANRSVSVHRHAAGRYGRGLNVLFHFVALINLQGANSGVQPTHETFAKRNLRWHAL